MRFTIGGLVLSLIFGVALRASDNALKDELKDPDLAANWIYDDLPKAMSEAKASGKPILMMLRCVPCVAGKTLDPDVARTPSAELETLEKNFVCVRVIKTQGLDLKQFQFDMDQSIAFFFFNTDGTVYGRYGTRAGNQANSDAYISTASFKKSAERALELHKGYPANKSSLEAKTAKSADYPTPESIPGLTDRGGVPVVRKNCIHCHMVRDYTLRAKWTEKKLSAGDLFVYPLPDNVGLSMNVNDGLIVKAVTPDLPAAKAGIAVGDEVVTLAGQPLISQADIQWVLQNAADDASLPISVRRAGKTVEAALALSGNWRESDLGWRASTGAFRRGFRMQALTPDERKKQNIPDGQMALGVLNLVFDAQKAMAKSGIQKGDIVIGIDDKTNLMTETQAILSMRLTHGPNDTVKIAFMHGKEKKEATVPLW